MQIPETELYIVAFAPFLSPETAELSLPTRMTSVKSADHGLALLRPSLYVSLPVSLSPEGGITLEFNKMADFEPEAIVARTGWMRRLREERNAGAGKRGAVSALDTILDMVELPGVHSGGGSQADDGDNEGDAIISAVLTRIFTNDDFRRMEAAWRGVALLFVKGGAKGLHLALVPVTRESAAETVESSTAQLDDAPPDLILLDLPFDATPVGMQLLESAAKLAERQMAPAICWFGPEFLNLDTWSGLEHLPYLPNHLDGFQFARWKAFRSASSAFWSVAACNGFSLELPSYPEVMPNYLSPVWGVAALLVQSNAKTGAPLGFASQLLQFHDSCREDFKPLETSISTDRVRQMVAGGLLPLMQVGSRGIHLPETVTVNGEPLLSQLTLSTIIHTLITLRESCCPADDPDALAESLEEAFSRHPRFKGALPDNAITFKAVESDASGGVILEVTLKKRGAVGQNIQFTFIW